MQATATSGSPSNFSQFFTYEDPQHIKKMTMGIEP